jgi:hypothetical protein
MGKALFRGRSERTRGGGSTGAIDFLLSYRRPPPRALGYREMVEITIDDLLAALRRVGYAPRAHACNDAAEVVGDCELAAPLVGAHVLITDARVRGGVRLQLPDLPPDDDRRLGQLAIHGDEDTPAAELGLFALRALDALLIDLEAARGDSALGPVAVSLLTSALADRPEKL